MACFGPARLIVIVNKPAKYTSNPYRVTAMAYYTDMDLINQTVQRPVFVVPYYGIENHYFVRLWYCHLNKTIKHIL